MPVGRRPQSNHHHSTHSHSTHSHSTHSQPPPPLPKEVTTCPSHKLARHPPPPRTCIQCDEARAAEAQRTHALIMEMCQKLSAQTLSFQSLDSNWGMRVEAVIMRLAYTAAQAMCMAEVAGVDLESQYQVMALSMYGKGMGVKEALEKVQAEKEGRGEEERTDGRGFKW